MKNTLLFLLLFVLGLSANAQDNTRVTLHAGETPIEQLLTDDQKQAVTHLSITGKLLDEDYAYLRSTLHEQLAELNLRDADIDTIPAHALECSTYHLERHRWKVIAPTCLKFLGDKSLYEEDERVCCVITGRFPSLGKSVINKNYNSYSSFDCVDNPSCVNKYEYLKAYYNDPEEYAIYSANKDTLFSSCYYYEDTFEEGVKVFAGHAFDECPYLIDSPIIIPASVDSIGDGAYDNLFEDAYTGYGYRANMTVYCYAETPPALGENVFLEYIRTRWYTLAVPESSIELYENHDDWNGFRKITKIILGGMTEFGEYKECIQFDGLDYKISAPEVIDRMMCYDMSGNMLIDQFIHAKKCRFNLGAIHQAAYILVLQYASGRRHVVKLK